MATADAIHLSIKYFLCEFTWTSQPQGDKRELILSRVGTVGDHNKHQVGGGICKSWDIKVTVQVRERCYVPNNGTQQLASVENKAVFEAK